MAAKFNHQELARNPAVENEQGSGTEIAGHPLVGLSEDRCPAIHVPDPRRCAGFYQSNNRCWDFVRLWAT